jgi:hypothetical protein
MRPISLAAIVGGTLTAGGAALLCCATTGFALAPFGGSVAAAAMGGMIAWRV